MTRSYIHEMQGNDVYYKLNIIDYLKSDKLPDGQKEARRIILECSDYAIIDDLSFTRGSPNQNGQRLCATIN